MEFFTRYHWNQKPVIFAGESKTQQQFRDDADINNIIKRYTECPSASLMDRVCPRVPQFGDFSNVGDLQRNLNEIRDAGYAFDALPATLRARFNNDPLQLLAFVQDSSNRDEAVKLGLIDAPAPMPVGDKVSSVSQVNAETNAQLSSNS